MLSQSGIPVIYSGDEIGQLNDYSYREDPKRQRIPAISTEVILTWELAETVKSLKLYRENCFLP